MTWFAQHFFLAFVVGAKRGGEVEKEKNGKAFSPQFPSLFPFLPIPYPFRRRLIFLFAPKHTDAREKKTSGTNGSQSSKTGPIFVKRPKTY